MILMDVVTNSENTYWMHRVTKSNNFAANPDRSILEKPKHCLDRSVATNCQLYNSVVCALSSDFRTNSD